MNSNAPFDETAAWLELIKVADKFEHVYDATIKAALGEALDAKAAKLGPRLTLMPWEAARIASLRRLFPALEAEPEPAPEPVEPAAADEPAAPGDSSGVGDAPTIEDLESAEELLRAAHVATVRGDKAAASGLLNNARSAAPNHPPVVEAVADEFRERGMLKEAFDLYASIIQSDGMNVRVEKKHAELAWRITGAGSAAFGTGVSEVEAVASARAAVWLSLFFPGLGQVVTGRTAAGVVFMCVWIVSWIGVWWLGFDHVLISFGLKRPPSGHVTNLGAMVLAGVAVLCHVVAIIDAASRAAGRRVLPTRPRPPSDLPFE